MRSEISKIQEIYNQNKKYTSIYLSSIDKFALKKAKEYCDTLNREDRINLFAEYIKSLDKINMQMILRESSFEIILSVFNQYDDFNNLLNSYLLDNEFEYFKNDGLKSIIFENFICSSKKYFLKIMVLDLSEDILLNNLKLNFDFNEIEKEFILKCLNFFDYENKKINIDFRKKVIEKIGFLESMLIIKFDNKTKKSDYLYFMEHLSKVSESNLIKKVFDCFFHDNKKIYIGNDKPDNFNYHYFTLLCEYNTDIYNRIKKYIKNNYSNDLNIQRIINKLDILLCIKNF